MGKRKKLKVLTLKANDGDDVFMPEHLYNTVIPLLFMWVCTSVVHISGHDRRGSLKFRINFQKKLLLFSIIISPSSLTINMFHISGIRFGGRYDFPRNKIVLTLATER